jgi:acyl-[acyl-carrier-protein]-phospholipid O-acyltransferase/long-chain-fatty-acid--[acyl-carrier-protein] ligase
LADSLTPFDPAKARRTLFGALVDALRAFGADRGILVDGDGRVLTYAELRLAALALGHALKKGTRKGEAVGVLLPTGIGSVIAIFALSAYGRVPAMLNFTAGSQNLQAALDLAKIKRIVTAHRFIELGKFQELEAELKQSAELIYLEDVRSALSVFDKGAAAVGAVLPQAVTARSHADSPAIILFTSGTEGEPKAVALSHANILTNVEQVRAHIALYTSDIVFNPLPCCIRHPVNRTKLCAAFGSIARPFFWRPIHSSPNICAPAAKAICPA